MCAAYTKSNELSLVFLKWEDENHNEDKNQSIRRLNI